MQDGSLVLDTYSVAANSGACVFFNELALPVSDALDWSAANRGRDALYESQDFC